MCSVRLTEVILVTKATEATEALRKTANLKNVIDRVKSHYTGFQVFLFNRLNVTLDFIKGRC